MFDAESFAEELRSKRARLKLSQQAVGDAVGASAATVCRTEKGKSPTVPVFLALCAWARLKPMDFWA